MASASRRSSASPGPRSSARDRTILAVKARGRRRWKKTSGYHGQARVENAFFRYKSIIGDGLRARSPAGQGSEVDLAWQHPESDDWAWQANVVPHRSVKELWIGIGAG